MSLFLERKYISLVSSRLNQFKQKGPDLYNFRCPFCGDSKKNKYKARGYVYRRNNSLLYKCQNCSIGYSFGNLLKNINNSVYHDYVFELMEEQGRKQKEKVTSFEFEKTEKKFENNIFINLPTIKSLSENHSVKKLINNRKIPEEYFSKFYYADNFKEFVSNTFPESIKEKSLYNEPRLIIPFYDEKNILQGIQGRAVCESPVKYITIKKDDSCQKIFGLERIDFTRPIYVLEGPIDSLFLNNALATMDSNLSSIIKNYGEYDYIFVFDNEPRNKEIKKNMVFLINAGYNIVIWPSHIQEKDINEMVISGKNIKELVEKNTFNGLRAKLEFDVWRK